MKLRRAGSATLVGVVALTLGACQLSANTAGFSAASGPGGGSLVGATLTNYGGFDGPAITYAYSGSGTSVTATAPSGISGNEREAFWYDNSPVAQDEESCAQWTTGDGNTQQGAILHLTRTADGGVRGISVVENVAYFGYWEFNFDTWDSDNTSVPYTQIGSVDLSSVVLVGNSYVPRPWSLCARTVGDQLQFVLWTGTNPRPPYGTPGAGGAVTIPSDYQEPGIAGWYLGHVQSGLSAGFDNLTSSDDDPVSP